MLAEIERQQVVLYTEHRSNIDCRFRNTDIGKGNGTNSESSPLPSEIFSIVNRHSIQCQCIQIVFVNSSNFVMPTWGRTRVSETKSRIHFVTPRHRLLSTNLRNGEGAGSTTEADGFFH